ncbi:MAG TPA: FAD-binding protein [Acidimicrobiia bacterium]|jgi:electron transfer flavoprotein alpha subunit|nr:FAD-binding protein [Acidimicrobiia bacterium]
MRIAVLVKQVPKFEEMELTPEGRLRRDGIELEMNPYCRRAVSQAVAIPDAQITVFTLGPPSAEDTLREAIAWGDMHGANVDGVLISDPAFAGSDTLATAKTLAAALRTHEPFDLILTGRNSVDADTGQVGPEVAELLDLPFLTGVRYLALDGTIVNARCEHDDGWLQAEVELPAVLSCAERLIDPAKVDPEGRALVDAARIRTLTAADLGEGPWGEAASPTWVGPVKVMAVSRARARNPEAPVVEQVNTAVRLLRERGALNRSDESSSDSVPMSRTYSSLVMVLAEPGRDRMTRELLGAAARLTGNVTAVTVEPPDALKLATWGSDEAFHLEGNNIEEDIARAFADLIDEELPQIVLVPSTAWGREIASRVAARIDAGLTGDAVELEMTDHALTAWKPAFGGQLVAAIGYRWGRELATVRPGVLPVLAPRHVKGADYRSRPITPRNRVRVLARTRDDDLDILADAHTVIGVGMGVTPDEYEMLEPLRSLLDAELGATRKVTDKGWLPRSRQIGITGRAIAPRLFVSIGASGKFNHAIGIRAAGTVLAINPDADAPIFDHADVGIVADWRAAIPLLVDQLASAV